jgi:CRP-like cAMP-binding protein
MSVPIHDRVTPPRDEQLREENTVLRALPFDDYARVSAHLEPVDGANRQVVWEPYASIREVWFPRSCVVSIVNVMKSGGTVEAATIGCEGVVGLPIALGCANTTSRAIVQVPGRAARMTAAAFADLLAESTALRALTFRVMNTLFEQTSQTAACNRLHSVEQRCARWLLMTSERARSTTFPLTQEFLAAMLGVRRAGVTVVAGELQRAKLISYRRGHVDIVDVDGLAKVSCECYRVVRDRYDGLRAPGMSR